MIDAKPNYKKDLREISLHSEEVNNAKMFIINYIRTTKYTVLTFIPLGLLY